jgi:hypothetical protein
MDVSEHIDEAALDRLEGEHTEGLSSAEILAFFEQSGIKFSEATLRKYVQLGLLPRSVRVGHKGKHQGSTGMYPATVVRQILRIKEMMAEDLTIEQIQREFLFVRGNIEELERVLDRIWSTLDQSAKDNAAKGPAGRAVSQEVTGAKALARDLVRKLEAIEARLTAQAQITRRATG